MSLQVRLRAWLGRGRWHRVVYFAVFVGAGSALMGWAFFGMRPDQHPLEIVSAVLGGALAGYLIRLPEVAREGE